MRRFWTNLVDHEQPFLVILADIDLFKTFHDAYGHQGGDGCLAEVAATMLDIVSGVDGMIGRFGGEEFVVLVRVDSHQDALLIAERMREAIDNLGRLIERDHMAMTGWRRVLASLSAAVSTWRERMRT